MRRAAARSEAASRPSRTPSRRVGASARSRPGTAARPGPTRRGGPRTGARRRRASSPQPDTMRSPSSVSFSLGTASAASPSSRLAFHSSGSSSVRDATNFGIAFSRSPPRPLLRRPEAGQALVGLAAEEHRLGLVELIQTGSVVLSFRDVPLNPSMTPSTVDATVMISLLMGPSRRRSWTSDAPPS
jgi:hypothetical protein